MKLSDREDKATERFRIITPLLDDALDDKAAVQLRKELARQYGIDERTLRRWVGRYKIGGFEALKPARRSDEGERVIPKEILDEAIQLRREVPKRSVKTIISIMEMDGRIPEGSVKRSTLQDALAEAGFSKKQMSLYAPPVQEHYARRFQKQHRNESWQCDVKYGPWVEGQQSYLFTVIDDATRYILHSEFFFRQDQASLNICLKKAFTKAGLPDVLYLDNGKIFKSADTNRMAAKLGIRLTHIKPYTPCGHGKVERFNNTVDGFINEIKIEKNTTLQSMNHFYEAWLEDCYQNAPHSALKDGLTPKQAFEDDERPLRFAAPDELSYAFQKLLRRKVNKSGCISVNNEQWEIDLGSFMIGKTVDVLVDSEEPEILHVECGDLPPATAKKLVIQPNTNRIVPDIDAAAASSQKPQPTESRFLRGLRRRFDERAAQHSSTEDTENSSQPAASVSDENCAANTDSERRSVLRFSASRPKGDQ